VFTHYGLRVQLIRFVPKHRWNFSRVDWDIFARNLDQVIQFIPADESGSHDRFTKAVIAAAKHHIPRGYRNQYIPGWDHQCDKLYERFNSDDEKESAVRLLEMLNQQRKSRWEDIVEKTNFTHSSRKAWNLFCVSKAPMDKNHARAMNTSIRGLKGTLTTDPTLSANFIIN
jgi:hypothetical protein